MVLEMPALSRKHSRYDEEEKRSKSTAPMNAALTQVLDQIQRKFESKRKLSPSQVLIRHNERMERSQKLK
jgi:hypothetical protein